MREIFSSSVLNRDSGSFLWTMDHYSLGVREEKKNSYDP